MSYCWRHYLNFKKDTVGWRLAGDCNWLARLAGPAPALASPSQPTEHAGRLWKLVGCFILTNEKKRQVHAAAAEKQGGRDRSRTPPTRHCRRMHFALAADTAWT